MFIYLAALIMRDKTTNSLKVKTLHKNTWVLAHNNHADYMMALGGLATGIAGIATAQWEQEAL